MTDKFLSSEYSNFLKTLKERVASAQYSAARTVNKQLILLYHHIGSEILRVQKDEGWGSGVIERLSRDLSSAFPNMKGFSPTNLRYMRVFASEFTQNLIQQQAAAELPWSHIVIILQRIKKAEARAFYIRKSIENGWSRNVLSAHIERQLYERAGNSINNFAENLTPPQSDLAHYTLKDPYLFDFLGLNDEAQEREIERSLVANMQKFLLELGAGFSFVGQQYHLSIGNKDFYIDLLFYHLKLRCFVVIELKAKDFEPEHAGKMNFYLSAVDDILKHPTDNPSIGIILCKTKNKVLAEYALRDLNKPIGLSEYRLEDAFIENFEAAMPSIEELEAELSKNLGVD
jgi:predicted nuclease of restriction endonuclease-like (RecB) superfamily